MKVSCFMAFAITILCMVCVPLASASVITVNFDNLTPACCSGNAPLNNVLDSWMTFGVMRISGGAVMADSNATTAPNVYAAADLNPSNRSSGIPDHIEMVFSSPVSNISFDVINGGAAAGFIALAFDSDGNQIGVDTINLNCSSCAGGVSHVSFNLTGIGEVVLRNNPATSTAAFAVDTVSFDPVPEPAGLTLLGGGIVALWSQRKRFLID